MLFKNAKNVCVWGRLRVSRNNIYNIKKQYTQNIQFTMSMQSSHKTWKANTCLCGCVKSNSCGSWMLCVRVFDTRLNAADGLTMTNLTYNLHNNRSRHRAGAQLHRPIPHVQECTVTLTAVLLIYSRALLDSEGMRSNRPATNKTNSTVLLGKMTRHIVIHQLLSNTLLAVVNSWHISQNIC